MPNIDADQATNDDSSPQPRAVTNYIGPALGMLIFLGVVLKVLIVAHFDPTTALGIIAEGTTTTLLLGAVAATLGLLLISSVGTLIVYYNTGVLPKGERRVWRALLAALGIASLIFAPATLGLMVGIMTVEALIRPPRKEREKGPFPRRSAAWNAYWARRVYKALGVLPAIVAIATFFSDTPWLPAERIAPAVGPGITGYVVRTAPEATLILVHNPRHLVRVDGKVGRTFCRIDNTGAALSRPLLANLYSSKTTYPICKTVRP